MHLVSSILALALVASLASAAPAPLPTAAAELSERATSCTFSGSNGASSGSASKKSCPTIVLSNVAVPAGKTLDLTDLSSGTQIIFEGTTNFGYKEWTGPLVSVSGTEITVASASGSVLNGGGAQWWDGLGSNGGKTKPTMFYAHSLTNSLIQGISILNSPVQVFSIDGSTNLVMTDISIDDSAGNTQGGHNTDGFDIGDSTTGIYLSGITVKNQDDCIAINSGTNITFTSGTCSGGHGLSIGSVGGRSDNTVSDVTIENSSISESQNGVRVKTVSGATGSVTGVTYRNIQLGDITDYGIVIEQDYENGSPTGTPTAGVPIRDLTLDGITGSVSSSATGYLHPLRERRVFELEVGGCRYPGGKTSTKCENIPSGASCVSMRHLSRVPYPKHSLRLERLCHS